MIKPDIKEKKQEIIRGGSRTPRESFRFTAGDELWTLNMRKQAIREACMEIRIIGGRSLIAHAVKGYEWNPLVFMADALELEIRIGIPSGKQGIFKVMCCRGFEVDKTLFVFMAFVSRMERMALDSLEKPAKKEFRGIVAGNWHPVNHIKKTFREVMKFYLMGPNAKRKKKIDGSRKA